MINKPSWNYAISLLITAMLLVSLAWYSTDALGQVPVTRVPILRADSKIPIMTWRLTGPFSIDHKEELKAESSENLQAGVGRGHDFLKDYNFSEGSVDASTFLRISKGASRFSLDPAFDNKVVAADARNNDMYYKEVSQDVSPVKAASFYLAAVINSPRDQEIGIVSGVSGNMQLWLNHELLAADKPNTWIWISNFQHVIGARLKRGNNFILIKLSHKEKFRGNHLIVTLYPHAKALDLAVDNYVNPILRRSIIAAGTNLEIRTDLFPQHSPIEIIIKDIWNNYVDSARLSGGRVIGQSISRLKENNVYLCRVTVGDRTIEEPFYYGDPDIISADLARELTSIGELSGSTSIDVQSQFDRLRHLLLPDSRTSPRWDEKVIESIVELKHNLTDLRKGDVPFRQAPGTHLRGYRSTVDGQIQHYWLHVPAKALDAGIPIPLVIVVPFEVSKNRPFLESYFVADFDMTEAYRSLSDEYGFAVLQLWGRGNGAGGTAIGDSDTFEALDAVRRDYNIDLDRLYLLGFCEGGKRALLLGEHYPNRFAAIATDHPVTISGTNNLWVKYSSPIEMVQNLVDTPVFINHDEAEPAPTFESSAIFASRGLAAGVNVTLIQAHGGGVVHGFTQTQTEDLKAMFEFFKGKHRVIAKRSFAVVDTTLHRFGHGAGPIEDAFGGPILLVEGTHGTPKQNLVVHSITDQFRAEWRELYYVDCPWKRDAEVTSDDITSANLILIGDQDTNAIVKQIASRLPARMTPHGVAIEGKRVRGDHLGYIFTSRNPLNTKKYAIVIGMTEWNTVKGWKLYPSRDGQYDYMIYKLDEPIPSQIDAGYYNAEWSRFSWLLLHKYLSACIVGVILACFAGITIRKRHWSM